MIRQFKGKKPIIHESAFIVDSAQIIGDVTVGENSSVWFNVVVRGDIHYIKIGNHTNIQDGTVIHVTHDLYPVTIGDYCTIAHGTVLHGCTIGNNCLIAMGAVLLDGSSIGDNSIIAAGAVVKEGMIVSPGSLVAGVPAKFIRKLNDEAIAKITWMANNYLSYVKMYRD
ncbi:gamma carbonic anhydrase family protein [bacterium]|nr:gamma carbonic anhydrase family protein [bacterium]